MLPYTVLWAGSSEVITCRVHIHPIESKKEKKRKKEERKQGRKERRKIHWKRVMRLQYNVIFFAYVNKMEAKDASSDRFKKCKNAPAIY